MILVVSIMLLQLQSSASFVQAAKKDNTDEQLKQAQAQAAKCQQETASLQSQMEVYMNRAREQSTLVLESKQQLADCQHTTSQLQTDVENLVRERNALSGTNLHLQSNKDEQDEVIQKLTNKLEEAQKELDTYHNSHVVSLVKAAETKVMFLYEKIINTIQGGNQEL